MINKAQKRREKLKPVVLIFATFFNPFGFDALFALVMRWTGSYWETDLVFYFISACFFGWYYYLHLKIKKDKALPNEP